MCNTQVLGDTYSGCFKILLQTAATTPLEARALEKMASTIESWPLNDLVHLNKHLLKDAAKVSPVPKREAFVCNVIATLNEKLGTLFTFPKRTFVKEISALAPADVFISNCARLVPLLLDGEEPGLLKLALLLAHRVGVNKRVVLNTLQIGWTSIYTGSTMKLAISGSDNKHAHILNLGGSLRSEIVECLNTLKPPYTKKSAEKIMENQLKRSLATLVTEDIKTGDRRSGAWQLRDALMLEEFDLKKVTLSKLLQAAQMYGIATEMPGDLRDMLEQSILPTSADRLAVYSAAPRPHPISPNYGIKNPTPADEIQIKNAHWQFQSVTALSDTETIPEAIWVENRKIAKKCLEIIFNNDLSEPLKQSAIGTALYKDGSVYPNSWWAWVVKFLYTEGVRAQWKTTTYTQYLSMLLPLELMTFPSILDVDLFDQDDLMMLFEALEQNQHGDSRPTNQINLVWRMIAFAKQREPENAFFDVEDLENRAEGTLNKRAHILTPGELENLVKETYHDGNTTQALVLTLAGFLGLRPIEIMYLRKKDITLIRETAEFNIMISKTIAGRRCLPAQGLVPSTLYPLVLDMLTTAMEMNHGLDLFCAEESLLHQRREQIIQPAMSFLRSKFGNGIDMYTLRHGFASWCYVRMNVLAYPCSPVWEDSPTLKHVFFNKDLSIFEELFFYQKPTFSDPEVFYRLCRFMGHATCLTLPRTYIHTAGLVHSAYLATH